MSQARHKIVLIGNTHQLSKSESIARVLTKLEALGCDVILESEFARFLHTLPGLDLTRCTTLPSSAFPGCGADFAISMGGDGSFLRAAACVGRAGFPVLGLNTGHLGFLADILPRNIESALDDIRAGHYTVEQRSLLRIEKDGAPLAGYPYALNEVSVLKYDNSSLIGVRTEVDGALLTNYVADGLIVCTPTGSTGYSLSVGGPLIAPNSRSLCISAVAPHSLNVRPVILNDDVVITLHVSSRSGKYLISVDGRSETFSEGDTLRLSRADYTIGVMKVRHLHFFDTLRDKMSWGTDERFN